MGPNGTSVAVYVLGYEFNFLERHPSLIHWGLVIKKDLSLSDPRTPCRVEEETRPRTKAR